MNLSPARTSNTSEIDPKTSRATRALLAVCAVIAAALLLVSPLLSPGGGDTTEGMLAAISENPTAFALGSLAFTFGLLLLIPTAAGIAQLVRGGRGTAVTRTGAIMMMIGAAGVSLAAWSFFVISRVATTPGVDTQSMAAAMDIGESDPFIAMSWMIGGAFFVGTIVAAIGLLLGKAIPIWHAGLLAVGALLVFFAPGEGLISVLMTLPLCAGLALLAPRFMALPDEQYTRSQTSAPSSTVEDVNVPGPAARRQAPAPATTPPVTTGGPSIAAASHPTSREDKTL